MPDFIARAIKFAYGSERTLRLVFLDVDGRDICVGSKPGTDIGIDTGTYQEIIGFKSQVIQVVKIDKACNFIESVKGTIFNINQIPFSGLGVQSDCSLPFACRTACTCASPCLVFFVRCPLILDVLLYMKEAKVDDFASLPDQQNLASVPDWFHTERIMAGFMSLKRAVDSNDVCEVQSLICAAIDINCRHGRDSWGRTVLHHAVEQGKLEMIKVLVFLGADVNARDVQKYTPLHYILTEKAIRNIAGITMKRHPEIYRRDLPNRLERLKQFCNVTNNDGNS
jgi:hypothetical protein